MSVVSTVAGQTLLTPDTQWSIDRIYFIGTPASVRRRTYDTEYEIGLPVPRQCKGAGSCALDRPRSHGEVPRRGIGSPFREIQSRRVDRALKRGTLLCRTTRIGRQLLKDWTQIAEIDTGTVSIAETVAAPVRPLDRRSECTPAHRRAGRIAVSLP